MDNAVPPSDRDRQNPQYDARRIRDDAPGGVYYKGDGVFAVITAHKQVERILGNMSIYESGKENPECILPLPFNGLSSGFESFGWIVMFLGGIQAVKKG